MTKSKEAFDKYYKLTHAYTAMCADRDKAYEELQRVQKDFYKFDEATKLMKAQLDYTQQDAQWDNS